MSTPYISFVVAARNDNYGENFLHRFQIFVDALLGLWSKCGMDAELIIVEWNPPADRPRLKEALTWPPKILPGRVRFVEVSPDAHRQLPNSDKMPMFEYIAKNAGICRARGQFVLATNPDLIFSQELIDFIAQRKLSPDNFYRIDRYDVDAMVPVGMDVERMLEFCRANLSRVSTMEGTRDCAAQGVPAPSPLGKRLGGFKKLPAAVSRLFGANEDLELHTNASGDFFLMAKTHWASLKGYPELHTHSYIDGYICYMAASLGLKQIVLSDPMRIYHQEHDRSAHAVRPHTDYQLYRERCLKMVKTRTPEILNHDHWGLSNIETVEYEAAHG